MRADLSICALLVLGFASGCGRTPPTFVERAPLRVHTREVTSIEFLDDDTIASRGADMIRVSGLKSPVNDSRYDSDGADFGTVVVSPVDLNLASERVGRGAIAWNTTNRSGPSKYVFPPGKTPEASSGATRGWGLAYSPDGKSLAGGGSHENNDGFLVLWDTAKAEVIDSFPVARPITTVAFSPDGRTIATGSMDGKIILWDLVNRKSRLTIDARRSYLAPVLFTPDGKSVVSANESRWVRFWDPSTGQTTANFKGHIKAILSIAFHPNGQTMVSGDSGGTIFVWDVPSQKALMRLEPKDHGKVWALAFSPDGKILASGGEDKLIHLWDVSGDVPIR